MINDQPTVLFCFYWNNSNRCRSLIQKNELTLGNINNFSFADEFELDKIDIPDSKYNHSPSKIANYQGYPLILGDEFNVKLEMLVTTELPIQWIEQTAYPYGDS